MLATLVAICPQQKQVVKFGDYLSGLAPQKFEVLSDSKDDSDWFSELSNWLIKNTPEKKETVAEPKKTDEVKTSKVSSDEKVIKNSKKSVNAGKKEPKAKIESQTMAIDEKLSIPSPVNGKIDLSSKAFYCEGSSELHNYLDQLKKYPGLKELHLGKVILTDKEINKIANHCPNLIKLVAHDAKITSDFTSALGRFKKIERLHLMNHILNFHERYELFKDCKSLQSIFSLQCEVCIKNWDSQKFYDKFCPQCIKKYRLPDPINGTINISKQMPYIESSEDIDNILGQLKYIKNVNYIDVSHTNLGTRGVKYISQFCPNLKNLDLRYCNVTEQMIRQLQGISKLIGLDLEQCAIGDSEMAALAEAVPSLKFLSLKSAISPDSELSSLSKLRNLEVLDLSYNSWIASKRNLYNLYFLKSTLKSLDLSHNVVFPSFKKERKILDMTCSEIGAMDDSPINSEEFSSLIVSLYKLEELNLRGTGVTDDVIFGISRNNNLKKIILDGKSLTADCIKHLAHLTNCEEIDFNGMDINVSDLRCLCKLPKLKYIRGLSSVGSAFSNADDINWDEMLDSSLLGRPCLDRASMELLLEWFPKNCKFNFGDKIVLKDDVEEFLVNDFLNLIDQPTEIFYQNNLKKNVNSTE